MARFRRWMWFVAATALLVTLSLGADAADWEAFEISAQYRGSVKQSAEQLGCAIGYFQGLPDGQSQIIFHACVRDPEKSRKYYAFRLNQTCSRAPFQLKTTSEIYSRFEGFEPSHQTAARDLLALLTELRRPDFEPKPVESIEINGVTMKMQSVLKDRGRKREITVTRPGRQPVEGKFFFRRAQQAAPWGLEKFRLKRGKVSVSFVVGKLDSIRNAYAVKTPYDSWVFAR
ncbi:MAG TPA: hypothetical protein VIV61_00925 [Candidatus Ozemobacteraceae bacterium]